jgi:hypothetical protein
MSNADGADESSCDCTEEFNATQNRKESAEDDRPDLW